MTPTHPPPPTPTSCLVAVQSSCQCIGAFGAFGAPWGRIPLEGTCMRGQVKTAIAALSYRLATPGGEGGALRIAKCSVDGAVAGEASSGQPKTRATGKLSSDSAGAGLRWGSGSGSGSGSQQRKPLPLPSRSVHGAPPTRQTDRPCPGGSCVNGQRCCWSDIRRRITDLTHSNTAPASCPDSRGTDGVLVHLLT